MSTPEAPTSPAAAADQVQSALRQLAHLTRRIDDPREVYSVLGSLTSAVASLSQSLRQVAAVHERPTGNREWRTENSRATRVAAHEAAWQLHRAAEMLQHVNTALGNAHNAEARITYIPLVDSPASTSPQRAPEQGLGL